MLRTDAQRRILLAQSAKLVGLGQHAGLQRLQRLAARFRGFLLRLTGRLCAASVAAQIVDGLGHLVDRSCKESQHLGHGRLLRRTQRGIQAFVHRIASAAESGLQRLVVPIRKLGEFIVRSRIGSPGLARRLRRFILVRAELAEADGAAGRRADGNQGFFRAASARNSLVVGYAAAADEVLPVLRAALAGEIGALVVPLLKHFGDARIGRHLEGRAAGGAENGKGLPSGGLDDLLLLHLVDAAGLLVQRDQILHIVGRKGENKAVLAGVDDGGGFAGQLLGADEVLDVLGDDNLHTVVFPDALCKLEHEIQGDGEFGVNEHVGFVDDHDDLAVGAVFQIVVPVLDDLVIQILQNQKHLCIGDGVIAVRQHGLEVENGEVFVGRDRAGTVPDIGVASSGGELGDVIHQGPQQIPGKGIVAGLELPQHLVIEVVEDRVIGGAESG